MMFFSLYVQQNQWIVITLLAGFALMVVFCLTYWAMWRPRKVEAGRESRIQIKGPVSFMAWVLSFTPWALLLVVLSTIIYGITHLYMAATTLPNW